MNNKVAYYAMCNLWTRFYYGVPHLGSRGQILVLIQINWIYILH